MRQEAGKTALSCCVVASGSAERETNDGESTND